MIPITATYLGEQLRTARNNLGWSLAAAEQKTGYKAVVVGSYERGDRAASVARAADLLSRYGWALAVLKPGEIVMPVGETPEAGAHVEYAVTYDGGLIACEDEAEAARVVDRVNGGRIVRRVVRVSEWAAPNG